MIPPQVIAIGSRIGLTGAAIAVLGTFGAVQTVRLEGLSVWPINIEGCKARSARLSADNAALVKASAEAQQRAVQARMAEQQRLSDIAEKADDQLEEARRDALADARAYIERMRPEAYRGSRSRPAAAGGDIPAESGNGPDPAPVLDDPVIVEANDVLLCTDAVLRLETVQEWASGLNQ